VSRWSFTGWALLRRGAGAQLAPGGTLGGSQIGARLTSGVRDDVAVSARLHSPVDRPEGAEAAIGLEWRPVAAVPVRLLAERRQRIGKEGRSAFALTAHGGISAVNVLGLFEVEAYGQAGIVGLRSRDLFADGSARLAVPLSGDLSVGAATWGAAQPGAARLDLGPELTVRIPAARLRVSASYRVRLAGDAEPGSGPAVTIGTDF
jgi:hypothetical protein